MKSRQANVHKKKPPAARTSRKVIIDFPPSLYAETEAATAALSITRSSLVRSAVEDYLQKLRRMKLEKDLAEGYIANSAQAQETAKEFSHVDAELL